MNNTVSFNSFHPNVSDAAGVLSWVHIGDLHMTKAGEQNDLDLRAIVEEINAVFANSVTLRIWAEDADGRTAEDTVRVLVGNTTGISRERLEGDQDNALPAWPDHGLLGTQLGPNKNGRKW